MKKGMKFFLAVLAVIVVGVAVYLAAFRKEEPLVIIDSGREGYGWYSIIVYSRLESQGIPVIVDETEDERGWISVYARESDVEEVEEAYRVATYSNMAQAKLAASVGAPESVMWYLESTFPPERFDPTKQFDPERRRQLLAGAYRISAGMLDSRAKSEEEVMHDSVAAECIRNRAAEERSHAEKLSRGQIGPVLLERFHESENCPSLSG